MRASGFSSGSGDDSGLALDVGLRLELGLRLEMGVGVDAEEPDRRMSTDEGSGECNGEGRWHCVAVCCGS